MTEMLLLRLQEKLNNFDAPSVAIKRIADKQGRLPGVHRRDPEDTLVKTRRIRLDNPNGK